MDNLADSQVKPNLIRDIIKTLNFEPEDKFFKKRTTEFNKKSVCSFNQVIK